MSITGYFEGVIREWKTQKHTPTFKKNMKEVLRQFDVSLKYNEIDEDKLGSLKYEFKLIRDEVYKL